MDSDIDELEAKLESLIPGDQLVEVLQNQNGELEEFVDLLDEEETKTGSYTPLLAKKKISADNPM
jgi:hypothetical protein